MHFLSAKAFNQTYNCIPDVKENMKTGFPAGSKTFKVHLDGYDLTNLLKGEAKDTPRDTVYYFDQGANLNAIRWNDLKLSFATAGHGNRPTITCLVAAARNIVTDVSSSFVG